MLIAAANFTAPPTPLQWVLNVLQIVVIDVVLAGDNAVVIALAVRKLPARQRMLGLILGAGTAVVLRVLLTFFASQLLAVNYVKLVGGVLVGWIAIKLLGDQAEAETGADGRAASGLWSAVWLILVADITMSIDNVIAVAAAARDSVTLLIFGLVLSIPFVVFASNLLSQWMERHAIIVWIGAAILGDVAAEMIVRDPIFFPPPRGPSFWIVHGLGLAGAAAVLAVGAVRRRRGRRTTESAGR